MKIIITVAEDESAQESALAHDFVDAEYAAKTDWLYVYIGKGLIGDIKVPSSTVRGRQYTFDVDDSPKYVERARMFVRRLEETGIVDFMVRMDPDDENETTPLWERFKVTEVIVP